MTAIFAQDGFEFTPETKKALSISVMLHVGVLLSGMVVLPYISKPPVIPQPIAIEVINPADITTTNKPPSENKLKPVVEEPKQAPKVEKKVEAPPKVEAKEPPKVTPLEKPKEKKDTVKPTPKVPPLPTEKLEKPKPPEKKVEDKEEAVQQEDPLESLMKNLQDSEEFSDNEGADEIAEATPDAPFAEYMTQNELGALTNQLISCWNNIPSGAKGVSDLVVIARIWVNADRSLKKVEVLEKWREANDPAFAALAQSVRWAFDDSNCQYLNVPQDKYEVWKDQYIDVPFDPSHVT